MKNYLILRIGKLNSFAKISLLNNHNNRLVLVPNLNPDLNDKNELMYGSKDLVSDVKGCISRAEIKRKIKPDAVLASEIILTMSDDSEIDIEAWKLKNLEYLKKEHGENLMQVSFHGDETTSHIHLIVVPIVREKEGNRLSMQDYLSGKLRLRRIQSEYLKEMSEFGLSRGEEKVRLTHQSIKEFYQKETAKKKEFDLEALKIDELDTQGLRKVTGLSIPSKSIGLEPSIFGKVEHKKASERHVKVVNRYQSTIKSMIKKQKKMSDEIVDLKDKLSKSSSKYSYQVIKLQNELAKNKDKSEEFDVLVEFFRKNPEAKELYRQFFKEKNDGIKNLARKRRIKYRLRKNEEEEVKNQLSAKIPQRVSVRASRERYKLGK